MNHDGWRGRLRLVYNFNPSPGEKHFTGEYLTPDGKQFKVYGETDPAHRHALEFSLDYPNTESQSDDQRFEVYFFTQTKDGMAGITHWNKIPFGVRLTKISPLHVKNLNGVKDSMQHFLLYVPPGAIRMDFNMEGGSGDADIYVRYGQQPTISEYDYRPYVSGNQENVNIYSPRTGFWHAMIHGFSEYRDIELKIQITR